MVLFLAPCDVIEQASEQPDGRLLGLVRLVWQLSGGRAVTLRESGQPSDNGGKFVTRCLCGDVITTGAWVGVDALHVHCLSM